MIHCVRSSCRIRLTCCENSWSYIACSVSSLLCDGRGERILGTDFIEYYWRVEKVFRFPMPRRLTGRLKSQADPAPGREYFDDRFHASGLHGFRGEKLFEFDHC